GYVKSNFLLHLLEGTYEQDELALIQQEYEGLQRGTPLVAAIAEIDDVVLNSRQMSEETQHAEVLSALRQVGDVMDARQLGLHCKLSHFQMGLIFYGLPGLDLEAEMDRLVRSMKDTTKLTITLGVGYAVQNAEEVYKSFHHAKEMLNFKMFLGKNR